MRLWINDLLEVVHIGPDGPAHLRHIDVQNGTAVLVGDKVATDTLALIPAADTPQRLALAKSIKIGRINAKLDRVIEAGFTLGGYVWECDIRAQINIILRAVMILSGEQWPQDFTWRTLAGDDVAMTQQQFMALVFRLVEHVADCLGNARSLKNQVLAAPTVASVVGIDISEGWP